MIESSDTLRERFRSKTWRSGMREGTVCGAGSTPSATATIRRALIPLLERHGVKTINDAGCGDQVWLRGMVGALEPYDYLGYDVRESSDDYPLPYQQLEIVHEPMRRADLILCKDVFIHLRNETVLQAIANFRKSSILLLTTTYLGVDNKAREQMGDYAPLDLGGHPFNLCIPLESIKVPSFGGPAKQLALWKIL